MVNCFLKLPANSAHWASVIFQNPFSVVVGLNALILEAIMKPSVSDLSPAVLSQMSANQSVHHNYRMACLITSEMLEHCPYSKRI